MSFTELLKPLKIKNMEIRNRIVMPAMVANYAAEDGKVTQRLSSYLAERAKGEVGLIITEAAYVQANGRGFPNELGAHDDSLLPGYRELTAAVHRYGGKIALQLNHAGRQTNSRVTGEKPVSPSPLACRVMREEPRELTIEEIKTLVQDFGAAARRAREGGFDAVEVHGAHGYLINQFLSGGINKRTDQYGTDLNGRLKFALEVLAEIKKQAGEDFPVIWRMNAYDGITEGITLEEALAIATRLVAGGVDILHVSAGIYGSGVPNAPLIGMEPGPLVPYAETIKKAVQVPVIAVGKLHDLELANKLLKQGKADLIAMGRALLADPELPQKLRENRSGEIRPCITCNQGCFDTLFGGKGAINCLYNARCGQEYKYPVEPAETKKKVVIIGGGPAGMEAARVAALRGHKVTLYEKENDLGGQLNLAVLPPHKAELARVKDFLLKSLNKLKVDIKTGMEINAEDLADIRPEAVILATGAKPLTPPVPGIDSSNVFQSWDVLQDDLTGNKVVIIGGGLVGCETAEFLVDRGKQVTVLEITKRAASDMGPTVRAALMGRLKKKGVNILTNTQTVEIKPGAVVIETESRQQELSDIDSIVLACGSTAVKLPVDTIQTSEVYVIGDSNEPGNALKAIHEGFFTAYKL